MGKLLVTVLILSAYLFGSDAVHEGSTDIVQRTGNFPIFAGILYYLLSEPLNNYVVCRIAGIESELEKFQERSRESLRLKDAAAHKIDDANRFAQDLSEMTKKECKILSEKINAQHEVDVEIAQKHNNSLMDLEKRKMVREVVADVMADVMRASDAAMGKDAMTDILKKKVA